MKQGSNGRRRPIVSRAHLRGIAKSQIAIRHIFCDNRARSDDRAVSDGDTFQDDGAGPDEYSAADTDRFGAGNRVIRPSPFSFRLMKIHIHDHCPGTHHGTFAYLD